MWQTESESRAMPDRQTSMFKAPSADDPQLSEVVRRLVDAYEPLRNIRAKLKTAQQPVTGIRLVDGLGEYSEKGSKYVEQLRSMIRDNDLTSYDTE